MIAEFIEQVRAHGKQPMIIGELGGERLDQRESRCRAADHSDGDRVVERDHRVVASLEQQLVERDDLRPVRRCSGRCLVVNGRDSLTWIQRFDLDLWYLDNWSLWLDAKILVRTVGQVFRAEPDPIEDTLNIERAKKRASSS